MKKMTKHERDLLISDWITRQAAQIWKRGESSHSGELCLVPDGPDDLIIDAFQVTHFDRRWEKVGRTIELRFYKSMEDGEMAFGATLEKGPVVLSKVCSVYPGGYACARPPVVAPIPENHMEWCKLRDLDMSIRARECLKAYGLENATLEEFSYMSRKEVLGIPGIGRTTLAELVSILSDHGLSFRS